MPETNMTRLLERSLERNRLAHAYLFSGDSLDELEVMARTLAKALNWRPPGPPPNSPFIPAASAIPAGGSNTMSIPTSSGSAPNPNRASSPWTRCAT